MIESKSVVGFIYPFDNDYNPDKVRDFFEERKIDYIMRDEGILFLFKFPGKFENYADILNLKFGKSYFAGFSILNYPSLSEANKHVEKVRQHYEKEQIKIMRLLNPLDRTRTEILEEGLSTSFPATGENFLLRELYKSSK